MENRHEPEIEMLLQKYAGGRMPRLVDIADTRAGLVNGELLQILHSGMMSRSSIPFGILLAAERWASLEEKWLQGDFKLNEWAKPHWPNFCKTLRATDVGNEVCDKCDRRWAIMADRKGDVIAYLCDSGLIDIVSPISVREQTIAVIFCGQFKPKRGYLWNPELIQHDGLFRPLEAGEQGVDAWDESLRRMREVEQKAGLPENTLQEILTNSASTIGDISPQEVKQTREFLRKATTQLSNVAISTYDLERRKVVDWIRNRITHSLVSLSVTPITTSEVWRQLSLGLEHVVRYFGLDYALVLSCCDKTANGIRILTQNGLPEPDFPIGERVPANKPYLSMLKSTVYQLEEPAPISLRDYKNLPLFDRLNRLHAKKSKRVLVVPLPAPLGSATSAMLLGRFKEDVEASTPSLYDLDALTRITKAVTLAIETILLVEQLEETAKKQGRFLEDVAHDIRTPIQAIVVETEVLTRALVSPEQTQHLAQRIAAQVRRLHLMSQRVWTLISIDQKGVEADEVALVDVYQVLMEHRKQLLDLAAKRDIQITVDRELEGWPAIQVNKMLFSQAILNLIDNAIKYSQPRTEVRIDGRYAAGGVSLSFVNRGIQIREEDKGRIFERYYRTIEAQSYRQEGTGIGLSVVQAFVEHCRGDIEVKSEPIPGTGDYVTEFKISIPHRGPLFR